MYSTPSGWILWNIFRLWVMYSTPSGWILWHIFCLRVMEVKVEVIEVEVMYTFLSNIHGNFQSKIYGRMHSIVRMLPLYGHHSYRI